MFIFKCYFFSFSFFFLFNKPDKKISLSVFFGFSFIFLFIKDIIIEVQICWGLKWVLDIRTFRQKKKKRKFLFSVVKSIDILYWWQILQQHWEMWQVLGAVMSQMDKLLHPLVDCMVLWTSHLGHPLAPPGCHRLLKMEMKMWKQIVLKVETWEMTISTTLNVTCLVSPLTSGMVLHSVPPEQLVTVVKSHFPLQRLWIFRYRIIEWHHMIYEADLT